MEVYLFTALSVVPGLLGLLVIARLIHRLNARTGSMQRFAATHGFSFEERSSELDAWARRTKFLAAPPGRVSNVARRVDGELVTILADLSTRRRGYRPTLCLLRAPGLRLPHFVLRRERGPSVIERVLGVTDLDFDDDPEFSKAFVLRALNDEGAVRRVFTPSVRRRLLESLPTGAHLEGLGTEVLVHLGRPLEGPELEGLLGLGREAAQLLVDGQVSQR